MAKVFKVTPKRAKSANGVHMTPEMEVIVTTKQSATTPFYNGAVELKETYLRMYGVDLKKTGWGPNDFDFEAIG